MLVWFLWVFTSVKQPPRRRRALDKPIPAEVDVVAYGARSPHSPVLLLLLLAPQALAVS